MAEASPKGIATNIATEPTSNVPVSKGTHPKASFKISGSTVSPLLITQARLGFHAVLKKKSAKLTYWKNLIASKIREKNIPKVTRIATIELNRIILIIIFSTMG